MNNDSNMHATDLPGGAIRVSVGPLVSTATAAPDSAPSTYVHAGSFSHTIGGEVVQRGYASYQVGSEPIPTGSVMATAQRINGQDTVELQPGSPGSRTPVSVALREGLIRRVAGGGFEDASGTAGAGLNADGLTAGQQATQVQQAAQQQQQADAEALAVSAIFPVAEEVAYAATVADLPQHAYDQATAGMIASVAHGTLAESVIRTLAESAGIEPAVAQQHIATGMARMSAAVARAVAPLGIQGERLESFLASVTEQPGQLQQALQQLVHFKDSSGFTSLGQQFAQANPGPEIAALRAAGFELARDPSGGQLARRPGGAWVSVSDLIKG